MKLLEMIKNNLEWFGLPSWDSGIETQPPSSLKLFDRDVFIVVLGVPTDDMLSWNQINND